jgi:hypothetical protein
MTIEKKEEEKHQLSSAASETTKRGDGTLVLGRLESRLRRRQRLASMRVARIASARQPRNPGVCARQPISSPQSNLINEKYEREGPEMQLSPAQYSTASELTSFLTTEVGAKTSNKRKGSLTSGAQDPVSFAQACTWRVGAEEADP